jgi:transposase
MARPKPALILSDEERAKLTTWANRPTSTQRLALRARIVLACADEPSNKAVDAQLQVCAATVGTWRNRFVAKRLDGLVDEPRRGAPRTVTDADVERVVAATLETKPKTATHWSTRGMAKATGMSQSAISRIWRAFELKPHQSGTFKLSTDPYFVEKSQVQALDRTQPVLPMTPAQLERGTHDYVRNGTTSLFAALDVATGAVIGKCRRRHRHQEFLKFLDQVDATLPREPGVGVHIVLDNYATHKTPAVKRWFLRHPEYHLHFIPTSSSWLNQVERFFAEITEKRIRRGVFKSVQALEQAITEYLAEHNTNPKPFTWVADADAILDRIKRVCERTSDSVH